MSKRFLVRFFIIAFFINFSGYLLARLINRNADEFKKITHLIIDEVHERGKDTDLILLAVKMELENNKNIRVILMSATADVIKFSEYFDQCAEIKIPGHTFEVEIFHLREILQKTNYLAVADIPNQNQDPLSAYIQAQEKLIDHNLLVHVIIYIHLHSAKNEAILVFLPGYKEIIEQNQMIETQFETMHWDDYKLILLHSKLEDDGSVFKDMPAGQRKIILATNIAETSITINDVVHVIDVGLVKHQSFDPTCGSLCLSPVHISKACATQRAGRAGRTRMGFCYRLYSVEKYESMAEYTMPEIMRIALTEFSLKAKILAPDQPIIGFLQKALDPPPIRNLQESITLLKDINALNSNEEITKLGYHLLHMPVDCQFGKMVLYAIFLKCLDPIITIVSAMSVKDPFVMPTNVESRVNVNKARKDFGYTALSDHQMMIDMYDAWMSSDNRRQFCRQNYISNTSMEMIQSMRILLERYVNQCIESGQYPVNKQTLNDNALKFEVVKACIVAGLQRKFFYFSQFFFFIYRIFFFLFVQQMLPKFQTKLSSPSIVPSDPICHQYFMTQIYSRNSTHPSFWCMTRYQTYPAGIASQK